MDTIKVSANFRTSAVAGAIAGVVREHHRAVVQAMGAGAVNQAVKALVLATGYLQNDGIHVTCVPEFADVTIEDKSDRLLSWSLSQARIQISAPSACPREFILTGQICRKSKQIQATSRITTM